MRVSDEFELLTCRRVVPLEMVARGSGVEIAARLGVHLREGYDYFVRGAFQTPGHVAEIFEVIFDRRQGREQNRIVAPDRTGRMHPGGEFSDVPNGAERFDHRRFDLYRG